MTVVMRSFPDKRPHCLACGATEFLSLRQSGTAAIVSCQCGLVMSVEELSTCVLVKTMEAAECPSTATESPTDRF